MFRGLLTSRFRGRSDAAPGDPLGRRSDHRRGAGCTHSFAMGTVQPPGVHGYMDRELGLERRDRDVRHRVRLVDHQSRRQSDDSVPGAGRRQPAVVPVHPAVGRLGGRHQFPAAADCGRSRDPRGVGDFRRSGLAEPRDARRSCWRRPSCLASAARSLRPPGGRRLPILVPREDLDSATAANGVAFNVGRAAGPALGGLVIAALGIAVPFWIFAASNVVIVAALIWWRKPRKGARGLPAERLVSAVRAGVRHAANNPDLGATLMRVLAFFPFASAYLALLPLLARHQISGGPQLYGILLGGDRRRHRRRIAGNEMAEGRTRS